MDQAFFISSTNDGRVPPSTCSWPRSATWKSGSRSSSALGLYALVFGGFKGRAFVFCLLVTLVVSEQFLVRTLKSAIDRRRPKQVQPVRMVQLERTSPEFLTLFKKPTIRFSDQTDQTKSGPSFPSGHVTDNVIIATMCTLFFRRWGWLYFFVAAAVGYSRIYLGAHWPSDVHRDGVHGGGVMLFSWSALLEFLWRRFAPAVGAAALRASSAVCSMELHS